ncbi:MAG: TolC family protein [Gemmatimonadota bacterium]|nr:TolC family protein [Gemmatimonadota bacterium]
MSSHRPQREELEGLLTLADSANPAIRAARRRVEAASAEVAPAGLPPDPMLMAGIQNLPLGRMQSATAMSGSSAISGGPEPMTMRMIGISQTIPYPGKLRLRRSAAEHEVDATRAALDGVAREVRRDVKNAYYELAFTDQALSIVVGNRDVLAGFTRVTETRYAVGTVGLQDVLKAHVEATRLAESAVTLTEKRHATLARLNALLDRPTDIPVDHPEIPASVTRAAVPAAAGEIRFTSAALGSRAADSPLPPLADLEEMAIRESPEIREQEAMIAAQASRLELARKNALPDFDLSLAYGQRVGRPDMLTALVSVPIPVFKGRKQDQLVAASDAQLAALEAQEKQKENEIRADVARLVSELERSRTQLALYVKALLPQARASLGSATASYQVGRVEFLTVLDDQATVFNYETEYFRVLTDFAKNLAELERVVGKEVL